MKNSVVWLAAGLISLSLGVSSCGDTRSEAELVADASQKIAQGQYRSAVIDLRNALRVNASNLQARVALANALVELGDGAAAEKEIERAIELGAAPDDYARALAIAMLSRNGHAEVIAEIDPAQVSDPALASELTALRGRAMLGLGSTTEADRTFTDVLAAGQSVEAQRIALLGKASIAFSIGDVAAAERLVRQSLDIAPDAAESYLRLGQILLTQEKFEETRSLLVQENASKITMSRMETFRLHGDRALAFVGLGDLDAAADSAQTMAALAPDHPMSTFLRGRIEFQRGNLDRALEYLQQLNSKYPKYAPGQALLGAVYVRRGETAQAEEYLNNALALDPGNMMARQILAELRMRSSRPEDAAAMLRSGLNVEDADPSVLAALGRAAVEAGEDAAGVDYLRQSIAKDPDNMRAKLSLAAALVEQGKREEAIELIDSIPDSQISKQRRDLLIIVAQSDRQNPAAAEEKLKKLLAESSEDAMLRTVAGGVFLSSGNLKEARAQFERVVELEPDNMGAKLSVLRMDELENNFTKSKALFTAAREQNPRDVVPLIALARIAEFQRDEERSIDFARQAFAIDETALYPSVRLSADALRRDDVDSAARYAQAAVAANPDNARAHGVVALVQMRRGQPIEAVKSLRKAAELAPDSFYIQFELGRAQLAAGQSAQARDSFAKAHELDSSDIPSLRALALMEVRAKNNARADQLLAEARNQLGEGAVLDELIGDVRAAQTNIDEALPRFEAAHARAPSWGLVAKIYAARRSLRSPDATGVLTDWLAGHPDHVPARLLLAQDYQGRNDARNAIEQYEILLDRNPESALALNNLAWLYFEGGNPQKRTSALEMARKAHDLAPDSYDIADTYGWIQYKSGQVDAGVQTLRRALAATSPKRSPDIAYHLAAALHEIGASNEARETLLQALSTTNPFVSRDEAQRLYDSL